MTWLLLAFWTLHLPAVTPQVPNRQPQLAVDGKRVEMVFGSGNSIWLARSHDEGRTFQSPAKVADLGVLALGRHRGPRVTIAKGAIVVTAVAGLTPATGPHAHGLANDGDLLAWRSKDGGATWSQPIRVNDQPAAAREGLHAVAVDGNGTLAAVWLDLRSKGTRLYGSRSSDGGKTWSRNVLLAESPDGTICQCCDPSLVATAPGRFAVMFRNSVSGNRDMYSLRWSPTGATQPEKLGEGSWALNACPMDGGGIVDQNGRLASAWRREDTVYLSAGRTPEIALGKGKDITIAATAKGPYVAWASRGGIVVHAPSGHSALLSSKGAFPVLATLPDGSVLAAWEQDSTIAVQRLDELGAVSTR